jgi:hypothetical protein
MRSSADDQSESERLSVEDRWSSVAEAMASREWSDGSAVEAPVAERVEAMVRRSGRPAAEVVAVLEPRGGLATIELIAANAVLAGCAVNTMEIVIAGVISVAQPAFNLPGVQSTTHPCGVALVASGPVAARADLRADEGCMGPGVGSNFAIGRALRMILMNVGGARPGVLDRSCHGSPAKMSLCFAENLAASPWAPVHHDEGWGEWESTVSVIAAESPHNIQDHASRTAAGVLDTLGFAMRNVGSNNFAVTLRRVRGEDPGEWRPRPVVVVGPEHAATIGDAGLSRAAVREELWERSHVAVADIPREWRYGLSDGARVPVSTGPDDILLVVAGGAGKHSCWIPTMGSTSLTTVGIDGQGAIQPIIG